jgi:hypothetical protein
MHIAMSEALEARVEDLDRLREHGASPEDGRLRLALRPER